MGLQFFEKKRVLITGHTGFKGAWMTKVLLMAGAEVIGYALEAPTEPSLFQELQLSEQICHNIGDISDLSHMMQVFKKTQPEIVIHMAAQPLVRESYENPVQTYQTNVMGTVNVLECARQTKSVRSVVNVTTDKVYLNREWEWGYRENEELNGYDPYSNSKSCSELVTSCYKKSFFGEENRVAISTCRAGNVIGGGDFAKDRIIPDCIRAMQNNEKIIVRNPFSIRPYQHVLEPIMVYLLVAQRQYEDERLAGSYNVGPSEFDCVSTGELVDLFCKTWNNISEKNVFWIKQNDDGPHEANFLKLDCSKIRQTFGWQPKWDITDAMEKICQWTRVYVQKGDIIAETERQINEYMMVLGDVKEE